MTHPLNLRCSPYVLLILVWFLLHAGAVALIVEVVRVLFILTGAKAPANAYLTTTVRIRRKMPGAPLDGHYLKKKTYRSRGHVV